MQTSPRGAIAHNVLLPRNFQIQIQIKSSLTLQYVQEMVTTLSAIDVRICQMEYRYNISNAIHNVIYGETIRDHLTL